MRYPSKYVLITEVDTKINEIRNKNCNVNSNDLSKKSNIGNSVVNSVENENSVNDNNNNENVRDNYAKLEKNNNHVNINSELLPKSMLDQKTVVKSLSNIPMPANSGHVLPEKVWQDAIMNPAFTKTNESMLCESPSEQNKETEAERSSMWEFIDPLHKSSCVCIK
jgi:hypothetical protein